MSDLGGVDGPFAVPASDLDHGMGGVIGAL
jgi:hypothetical protein